MLNNNYGSLIKMPEIMAQATLNTASKYIPTKIVSNTPGRLRLRIAPSHRHAGEIQHIVKSLAKQPNIEQIKINTHNGSFVIKHDTESDSLKNVLATLTDLGIIFVDISEGKSIAAANVSNTVVDLNKRVEQATNGAVDLRFLFPLGLSILAVRQLMIKGLQFEIIPWYVLAWYAFDSFIKLNSTNRQQTKTE